MIFFNPRFITPWSMKGLFFQECFQEAGQPRYKEISSVLFQFDYTCKILVGRFGIFLSSINLFGWENVEFLKK